MKISLNSPEIISNPYPMYSWLRENEPVYYSKESKMWLVSRYQDAQSVLGDDQNFVMYRARKKKRIFATMAKEENSFKNREVFANAYIPRHVRILEKKMSDIAEKLISKFLPLGSFDVIEDIGRPFTQLIAMELLGMGAEFAGEFEKMHHALFNVLVRDDPKTNYLFGQGLMFKTKKTFSRTLNIVKLLLGYRKFSRYLSKKMDMEPQKTGEDSLIKTLLSAREDRGTYGKNEIFRFILTVALVAMETTPALIGNIWLILMQNPDLLNKIKSNLDLIPGMIEEILRYDPPGQMDIRFSLKEVTIGNSVIPAEQKVAPLIGSANRDPRKFSNPDAVDIERDPNHHLTFGWGRSYCPGAPIARAEAVILTRKMMEMIKDLHGDFDSMERSSYPLHLTRGLKHFRLYVK